MNNDIKYAVFLIIIFSFVNINKGIIKIIKNIPTIIIQGRYDLICPPKSAFLLAKNMSNCELKIIENSGHSMSEPNIKSNVLKAIDEIFYKIKKK